MTTNLPNSCDHVLHLAKDNREVIVNIHNIQRAEQAENDTLGQHTKVRTYDGKTLRVRDDAHAIIETMITHGRLPHQLPMLPWEGEERFRHATTVTQLGAEES